MRINRFCKGSFDRPAVTEPHKQCIGGYADIVRPRGHTLRLSVHSKHAIVSLVPAILASGSPYTVISRITKRIVNALKFVRFRRPLAHVSVKRFKRITPLFAYGNAASTISVIVDSIRLIASGYHARANFIFWRVAHSVACFPAGGAFRPKATTRHCVSVNHVTSNRYVFSSALTYAQPLNRVALHWPDSGKSAIRLTGNILHVFCDWYKLKTSHVDSFLINVVRGRLLAQSVPAIIT